MISRHYPNIARALNAQHSVLVLGARGSGKTYYLSRLIEQYPNHHLINLLDTAVFQRYLRDPSVLFSELSHRVSMQSSNGPLYVLIDEIQLLPKLMYEIHRCIDAMRPNIVFVLTGSSARKLKREQSDLLASRAISITLFPLGAAEIDFVKEFDTIMRFGSLPEILTTNDHWLREEKLMSYVGTYLNEEIKKESEIKQLAGFHRFLELAATLNGEPVNYSKISRAAGVSPPTVREYFGVLVDTLIAKEIPAWTYSIKKQLQRASKYYLFDNGIINALNNELGAALSSATFRFGKLFENLVVNELLRQISVQSVRTGVFHYRDAQGKEIDIILQRKASSPPVAIEIKSSDQPKREHTKVLRRFKQDYPNAHAILLCRCAHPFEQDGITIMPYLTGITHALSLVS